jgi:hypothetical protein
VHRQRNEDLRRCDEDERLGGEAERDGGAVAIFEMMEAQERVAGQIKGQVVGRAGGQAMLREGRAPALLLGDVGGESTQKLQCRWKLHSSDLPLLFLWSRSNLSLHIFFPFVLGLLGQWEVKRVINQTVLVNKTSAPEVNRSIDRSVLYIFFIFCFVLGQWKSTWSIFGQ